MTGAAAAAGTPWWRRRLHLPRPTRAEALVLAGLALCLGVLLRRALLAGEVFFRRDVHLMWYTQAAALVQALWSGRWPLWNDLTGFGQPLLADANNQLFYPTTPLHLLLRPTVYYTAFVAGHLALAAAGCLVLARRLSCSTAAAGLAALAFLASGPLLSLADYWNQLAGAAWLPWIVWAADRALADGRARDVALWALLWSLPLLAGSPEAALMAGVAGAVVGSRHAVGGERRLLRQGACLVVAALLAAAVSAAQWLPSWDVARISARSALPREVRTYWSLSPPLVPDTLWAVPFRRGPVADPQARDAFLASLYLGATTVPLAAAALVGRRRLATALLALAVGALLVALGHHTPVYDAAVLLLPPLRALRYPAKAMALAAFAWALLAGVGLDAMRRARAGGAIAVALAAALVCALAGTAVAGPPGGVLRALPAALACGLVVLAWRRGPLGRSALTLVGLCAAADFLWMQRDVVATAPAALYAYRPPVLDRLGDLGDRRVYAYDYHDPGLARLHLGRDAPYAPRAAPVGWSLPAAYALALRDYLYPPSGGVRGVAGSYDRDVPGLQPRPLALLVDLLRAAEGTPAQLRLLQLGAVARVIALHDRTFADLQPLGQVPGFYAEPIRVFAVPDAVPRAYMVAGARRADGPAAVAELLQPSFDPHREIVLPDAERAPDPAFRGECRVVSRHADGVVLETEANGPGYAVLVDAWDPFWTGRVDGAPAAVLRANTAFRAVAVPAGRHTLDLRYQPPAVRRGLLVSAAGLVLALGGLLIPHVRREAPVRA